MSTNPSASTLTLALAAHTTQPTHTANPSTYDDAATWRFDRRRTHRHPTPGSATARLTGHHGPARLLGVTLIDSSARGLGLDSPEPVEPGVGITLHFGSSVPGRVGTVRRCVQIQTQDGPRYRLGVETCSLRAA